MQVSTFQVSAWKGQPTWAVVRELWAQVEACRPLPKEDCPRASKYFIVILYTYTYILYFV